MRVGARNARRAGRRSMSPEVKIFLVGVMVGIGVSLIFVGNPRPAQQPPVVYQTGSEPDNGSRALALILLVALVLVLLFARF